MKDHLAHKKENFRKRFLGSEPLGHAENQISFPFHTFREVSNTLSKVFILTLTGLRIQSDSAKFIWETSHSTSNQPHHHLPPIQRKRPFFSSFLFLPYYLLSKKEAKEPVMKSWFHRWLCAHLCSLQYQRAITLMSLRMCVREAMKWK